MIYYLCFAAGYASALGTVAWFHWTFDRIEEDEDGTL